ncbi:MAG: hypothetical protein ACOY3P_24520 [Planctomycetota bacterium]
MSTAAPRVIVMRVARPRCKACLSVELATYKTLRRGAVLIRYARCVRCGQRFRLIFE